MQILELKVRGNGGEGRRIVFGGPEVVEARQLHQVCVQLQVGHVAVCQFHVARSMHASQRVRRVLDLTCKLEVPFEISGQPAAHFVEVGQKPGDVDSFDLRVSLKAGNLFQEARRKVAGGSSRIGIRRMCSACCCWSDRNSIRLSLVTPSTRRATEGPNSEATSSMVTSVSSTVSWSSAAASVWASRPRSARIRATWSGCSTYSSPDTLR